jgi:class 3 adenylate cyclase
LISVTASYTVLGVIGLALVFVGLPRAAVVASDGLGIDAGTGQAVFSLLLAAILVPAHRWLRPQVDRLVFRDRYALEQGVSSLLHELSKCGDPEALCDLVGQRLDTLVRPAACVVYRRRAEIFVAVFTRGRAVPTAFESDGELAAALAHRHAPLVAQAWQQRRMTNLKGIDRAALDTLGVAVVLPVHRRDELVAFVCLGAKRSGDIYTETDLTLLGAVAGKLSDETVHHDLADVVQKGRMMEEQLRRYVPTAITTQLASGEMMQPKECEISVLFVDIRGYTTFAATRQPAEVFAAVNRYAETVSAIARSHGGAVAEFGGDGMMVVFGAPQVLPEKERAAVLAGREIIAAVGGLAPEHDDAPLSVGVGIATGLAFVGDVRSVERHIWTAIGDTVNLAARLQQLTRTMNAAMVIDAHTHRAAGAAARDFAGHAQTAIRGRAAEDVWTLAAPNTAA